MESGTSGGSDSPAAATYCAISSQSSWSSDAPVSMYSAVAALVPIDATSTSSSASSGPGCNKASTLWYTSPMLGFASTVTQSCTILL
ncbi:MAG: hypothetical protein FJ087_04030 [Deltaproteobacteria bacterium]|nr:hypothetical protein [Deltaproteobacteria bacterium]